MAILDMDEIGDEKWAAAMDPPPPYLGGVKFLRLLINTGGSKPRPDPAFPKKSLSALIRPPIIWPKFGQHLAGILQQPVEICNNHTGEKEFEICRQILSTFSLDFTAGKS